MQRRRFIGFSLAHAGRPQASHARICLTVMLSGMACMLSSHSSLSQDRVPQGKEGASDQQVFNNACRTCHTLKEGDNRQGPNLHSIIGRKAGSLPDYNYSSAMKQAGFVWDKDKLEHFIEKPRSGRAGPQDDAVWRSRVRRRQKQSHRFPAIRLDRSTVKPEDCTAIADAAVADAASFGRSFVNGGSKSADQPKRTARSSGSILKTVSAPPKKP